MKIKWIDIENGEAFFTNAVPFDAIVGLVSQERGDKVWRTWAGWAPRFHREAGAIGTTRHLVPGDAGFEGAEGFCPFPGTYKELYVTEFRLFGRLVAREVARWEGDWGLGEGPYFEVVDGEETIFARKREDYLPEKDKHDWKVLAELSGKAALRRERIAMACQAGQMAGQIYGNAAGALQKAPAAVLPLMDGFAPSERGGHIVKNCGKFVITKTNLPGYYKVTREMEKVRFADLMEPFQIV